MKKMLITGLAAIAMLTAVTSSGSAESFNPIQLAKVVAVEVEVEAEVEGGWVNLFGLLGDFPADCLDDPDALKTEAELVLRRAGIQVVEAGPGRHTLLITVSGSGGGWLARSCSASVGLMFYKFDLLAEPPILEVGAHTGQVRWVGPKISLPQRLSWQVNQITSQLVNEILKARVQ